MRQYPEQVLPLTMMRLKTSLDPATLMYWPLIDIGGAPRWLEWGVGALDLLLVLGAAGGASRLLLRMRQLTLTQLLALGTVVLGGLSIAVFEGQGRYLIPLMPAMLILAVAPPDSGRPSAPGGAGHATAGMRKVFSTLKAPPRSDAPVP
jgi:hypothetical protein